MGAERDSPLYENASATRSVTLLMIDAEGFDDHVLHAFPFGSVHVDRVIYESQHLSTARAFLAARLMHSHGFVSVNAPLTPSGESVWHHGRSREVFRVLGGRPR